jgi:hypothetical protein
MTAESISNVLLRVANTIGTFSTIISDPGTELMSRTDRY